MRGGGGALERGRLRGRRISGIQRIRRMAMVVEFGPRVKVGLGAGDGERVERDSLLEALEFGGEAMSREELVAAAVKLVGPGATLADLVPETVSASEFAEDVLGFVGVDAEEGIHA